MLQGTPPNASTNETVEISTATSSCKIGLVMSGGGARAAYQVGVLRAIGEMQADPKKNPFAIICGTSAGAINAAGLASQALNFQRGIRQLITVWKNFHTFNVYRSDFAGLAITAWRWLTAFLHGRSQDPVSLLDNTPLGNLLQQHMDFSGIQKAIDAGSLYAFSVTASGYNSGHSISFFQGQTGIPTWKRARRLGMPCKIGVRHLMASSSIPFIFPPIKIHREYFGDGSMRQIAPLSPALHLGAEKLFIISLGRPAGPEQVRIQATAFPSLAQVAGHALNSIFMDSLEVDIERLQRINATVNEIPDEFLRKSVSPLKKVEFMVIYPSEDIEKIASKFVMELPLPVRILFSMIGAMRKSGSNLLSYLLFERSFCRALIKLGYKDAMDRRKEIEEFLHL